MDRLQTELHRLYLPLADDASVRALVIEVAGAGGWSELAKLWRGVQADLELPAPAIAVSGTDSLQLWFSLARGVLATEAAAFRDALVGTYLHGLRRERIRYPEPTRPPPVLLSPERWSAFVAQDLAPLFDEEPWLDHPPGVDAQADLLSRVVSIKPELFARASARLLASPAASAAGNDELDPKTFLLQVMRDPSVDLRLRIEAAKALL